MPANDEERTKRKQEQLEALRQQNKKIRKTLLLIAAVFVAAIALFVILSFALRSTGEEGAEAPKGEDTQMHSYLFYEIDYNEDIFQDESYLALNREILLDMGGLSVTINEDTCGEYGADAAFFYRYINAILHGEAETYSAFFSDAYYATGVKPLTSFTMQKLYNITLRRMDSRSVTDENGKEYHTYSYVVEYMIYRNNGTFRNDMGSDAIRAQYFVISDREGDWRIDSVSIYHY